MALMEADGMRIDDARNTLGAMINRSAKSGEDLGAHVSRAIYQPTIEPSQQARLDRILKSPYFSELTGWAQQRAAGQIDDPVGGATHFLAPEKTMLALEARDPRKYRSWRSWTGFDPKTGSYNGVMMRDASHAFLAPDGAYTAPASQPNVAMNAGSSGMSPTGTAGVSGSIHTATPSAPSTLFKDTAPVSSPSSTPTPYMIAGSGAAPVSPGAFGSNPVGAAGNALGAFAQGMGGNDELAAASQKAASDADADYQKQLMAWVQNIRSRRA